MQMHGHTAAVHALHQLPNGDGSLIVSCSADGAVRLWCLATLRCVRVLLGHSAAVLCAVPVPLPPLTADTPSSEPPPELFTGAADGTLRGWAGACGGWGSGGGGDGLRCGAVAAGLVPAAHEGEIYAVCVSGTELVSAGKDGQLRLWSAATLRPTGMLGAPRAHRAPPRSPRSPPPSRSHAPP